MKTAYMINLNYRAAVNQAEALQTLARTIETDQILNYEQILSRIRANWQGDNSEAYCQKAERLIDDMQRTVNNLQLTAGTIVKIAENVRNAELTAIKLAETRNF